MLSPESRRNNKLQHYVLQFKKCITAAIWNTLKHKRNPKPTLIGAVDGGTGTMGSHVAKLILYTSLSLACVAGVWKVAWSRALIPFPFPFERLSRRLLYPQCAFQTEIRGVCAKTFFTTASVIFSYFARKGELLFTNSDQIADRLCELSKKEQKSVHYMNI